MIEIDIPGTPTLRLRHLVLDVNGTLAVDGILLPDIADRLQVLRPSLDIHLLTADTHGTQEQIDAQLGLTARRLDPTRPGAPQKEEYVRRLGIEAVVAIGNGANDVLMLRAVALAIAVVSAEGLAGAALREADVFAPRIEDALDLLRFPRRLSATLRA